MRRLLVVLAGCGALIASSLSTAAADAVGCNGFLWPLATELAWMKAADSETVKSGATLPAPPEDKAIALSLLPASQVSLPVKPTSTPKPEDAESFSGFVSFEQMPAGHYQISLSSHGWIDVIQNGKPLEATGHTGSKDCADIRKSVRFEIEAGTFSLQVNGVRKDTIKIAVRPAAD